MTNRNIIFWVCFVLFIFLFTYLIRSVLLPFVLGGLTAYFLDPATDRLQKAKLSRGVATSVIIACFFVLIMLLSFLGLPVIGRQLMGLITSLPGYVIEIEQQYAPLLANWLGELPAEQIEGLKQAATNFSGQMAKFLADFASSLFQSGMAFINVISLVLITPLVTFYLLRDWDHITSRIDKLLPRKHAATIREQLSIIDKTLAGFIRGQLNVCFVLAIFYALALSAIGLKFGIVIGVVTGLLVILPYIGFMVGFLLGMGVAFFQFDSMTPVIAVFAAFMAGQVIESYFLTPKLVGERVGLHPVWVIFGMLVGAALFGFVGILLSIPVTAIIGVLIRFGLSHYLQSDYYKGGHHTPTAKS